VYVASRCKVRPETLTVLRQTVANSVVFTRSRVTDRSR